jgi:O-antigen ligase
MRLAAGVVFIGFVLALFGIGQKAVLGDQVFDGMRIYGFWQPESLLTTPFGPFVNKNHFAGWMLMGIPLALGMGLRHLGDNAHRLRGDARGLVLWLSEPDGGRLMLYVVAALFMALSLLMTGSRSGLGCFAVIVVGAAVWTGRRGGSWRVSLGAAVAALALVLVALQWAGRDAALERFTLASNNSVGLRLDIWRISALIVRDFPVLGTGMNTFGLATYQHQPGGLDTHYNEAHNEYVQLLVEGGAITFLLALVAIAAVARAVLLRFRANDDGPEAYWVRVGATAGLAAIALQSLVEFSLQMPGNTVLFVLLLAMALHTPAPIRRDSPSRHAGHVGRP